MTAEEKHDLVEIATGKGWEAALRLKEYLSTAKVEEAPANVATGLMAPTKGIRTGNQNRAMHVGFQLIVEALTAAGLDMRKVLKPEIDIPWTPKSVKEYLFRPVMTLMTSKESTRELNKHEEITEIWETVMRFLMQNHGIDYIPFPNDPTKNNIKLAQMENLYQPDYPEQDDSTLADKF
jgi:hypothetical protein